MHRIKMKADRWVCDMTLLLFIFFSLPQLCIKTSIANTVPEQGGDASPQGDVTTSAPTGSSLRNVTISPDDTASQVTLYSDEVCNGTNTIQKLNASKGRVVWDSAHCTLDCSPCKFTIRVGGNQGLVLQVHVQSSGGQTGDSVLEISCPGCDENATNIWTVRENESLGPVVVRKNRLVVKARGLGSQMLFSFNYTAYDLDKLPTVSSDQESSGQDGSSQKLPSSPSPESSVNDTVTTQGDKNREDVNTKRADFISLTSTETPTTETWRDEASPAVTTDKTVAKAASRVLRDTNVFTFEPECNGDDNSWTLRAPRGRIVWDSAHCTVDCSPCKFIIRAQQQQGLMLKVQHLVIPKSNDGAAAGSALEIYCPKCPEQPRKLWIVPENSTMDPIRVRENRLVVRLRDPTSSMKFDLNYTAYQLNNCIGDEDAASCTSEQSGCHDGWLSHGSLCFRFVFPSSVSPIDAHNDCVRNHKGMVASFPDKASMEFAARVASPQQAEELVVGLERVKTDIRELRHLYRFQWWWPSFKAVVYDKILATDAQNTTEGCIALRLKPNFKYRQVSCLQPGNFGYACFKENPSMTSDVAEKSQLVNKTTATQMVDKFPTKNCSDGSLVHPFHPCRGAGNSKAALSASGLPVMTCGNGLKVHYSLVCDGIDDCGDHSDEEKCDNLLRSELDEYFFCKRRIEPCVRVSRCNGIPDCNDGSDEENCPFCRGNTSYHFGYSCLPKTFFLETCRENDTSEVTEECIQDSGLSSAHMQVDLDGYGMAKFKLLGDEESCPETHVQCPDSYCIPVYLVNNGQHDCPYPHTDDEPGPAQFSCEGYYRCYGHDICLHNQHLCDGIYQCPLKDDERYCNMTCPLNCTCEGHALTCKQMFDAEERDFVRYLDLSGSFQPKFEFHPNMGYLQLLNMSFCSLHNVSLTGMKQLKILDLSYNMFAGLNAVELRDMKEVTFLDLSHNPRLTEGTFLLREFLEVSQFRKLRFFYLINTGITYIEPKTFQDMNNLRTLDLRSNNIKIMDKLTFEGLHRLRLLNTDDARLCCSFSYLNPDSKADCNAPVDELSSCSDLLRSSFFRACLWVLSTLAVVGNTMVLIYRVCLQGRGRSSGYRALVASLCVADLLMGVYLAMIGAADAHYSGQYLWKREEWTGSGLCQAAGVLGLMASEVSAMIICLITIDRLIVLRFPLKFHLHMTARSALLASGVAWMLGVLLAVTPFAADWEFYSQTGICLPLPITQRDFPGQHYSFGVFIVLNFVLFCLIGVGQVIIYRAIRDTHKAAKTHCTKQDMAIARRLFLIVFTDFCCWFPVGVMGLLAANGTPIAGVVNVWTAIFILPLNSAINPFLYTINSLLERRRKRAEDKRVKMMMRKLNGLVNSWPLDKVNELYSHVSHVRRRLLEGRSPHHAGTQGQDYEMMSTCTDYTEHSEHSGYTAADSDPDRNTDYETVDLENNGEDERDSQSVQIFCVAPPSDERVATSPAM